MSAAVEAVGGFAPTTLPLPQAEDDFVRTQREYLALLERKKQFVLKHRIYWFSPLCNICGKTCRDPAAHNNPVDRPQWAFLHSRAHIRMAVGTNRGGKTTIGVVDDICDALGFFPWLLPEEAKAVPIKNLLTRENYAIPDSCRTGRLATPVKIIIIAEDWDVVKDVFLAGTPDRPAKLWYYLPTDSIARVERNSLGYDYMFHLWNGSSIKIDTGKSFVNNPKSFEGPNQDKAHYDEPPRRDMRVAISRGLADVNGYETFTLTPLTEPWLKDEVFDKANVDQDCIAVHLDAEKNPYVDQEGWRKFGEKLDETERAARLRGEWVHLRGLVYKEFKPKLVKDGGNLSEPLPHTWLETQATVYTSHDPHPKLPIACAFMAVDAHGRMIIFDEIFMDALIPDVCAVFKEKLMFERAAKPTEVGFPGQLKLSLKPARNVIDPIAYVIDPVEGRCWADAYIENDVFVEPAPKQKEAGIHAVRLALKEQRLIVCKNCTRTIWEFQHYIYKAPTQQLKIDREKPIDKDDHMMEAIYRLVLLQLPFIDPTVKSKPIKGLKLVCP